MPGDHAPRTRRDHSPEMGACRFGERDMSNNAVAEERMFERLLGPVHVLVRKNYVPWAQLLFQAADRADGHDPFHTQCLERVDVRLVVDF